MRKEETVGIHGVGLQMRMTTALGGSESLVEAVQGQGNVIEQAPLKASATKVEGHHAATV